MLFSVYVYKHTVFDLLIIFFYFIVDRKKVYRNCVLYLVLSSKYPKKDNFFKKEMKPDIR